jgi:hypothetical protein
MNSKSKNPQRRPEFGQAAKVVNLYIKQYLLRPPFMGKQEAARAQRLYRYAHVPLDGIVLDHVWEEFHAELSRQCIKSQPKMGSLRQREYEIIQDVIYRKAKKLGLPPLAYDFRWVDR